MINVVWFMVQACVIGGALAFVVALPIVKWIKNG